MKIFGISKKQWGMWFAKYRARCARGNSFTGEITGALDGISKGGIIILLLDRFLHVTIPLWILLLIWFLQKIFEYFLGWYDEKKLKFWEIETDYIPTRISPYMRGLKKDIEIIKEEILKNKNL